MPEVAIVGAGMAGLAAASRLASKGITATVLESSKQLGGRARGINYQDLMVDNGQHIMLGAYHDTLSLLKQAGVEENEAFLRLPLQLHIHDMIGGETISLQTCNSLPAPFHILGGFIFAKGLSLSSKLAAIRMMTWARCNRFQLCSDMPLAAFLAQQKQSQQLISSIWEPLCLAALNTPIADASAQVFLNVLRDSFARQKSDSDLLLPRSDLSKALVNPLANWLKTRGVKIAHETIKSIEQADTGFHVITNIQTYSFSHVVLACGPYQLKHIALPSSLDSVLPAFEYQPITTVYLQFEKHIELPRPMTGMVNSITQWVLDRGRMCGQNGLLAAVISADKAALDMRNENLAEKVITELQQSFPGLGKPVWYKVITEKFATFSCKSGMTRPTALTTVPNLFLTGDYIENGYPATIEGAVRNGLSVADMLQSLL